MTQLKNLCSTLRAACFIGAHDALTARLGEQAGFDGVWASGLEISASHCVADDGCLPREEIVERVSEMASAISIPILVDIDNGGSTPEAVLNVVRQIEDAGAAGVVIEDKYVPKRNSLMAGGHSLEPVELVCEKLRAALAARHSECFSIVARSECLIAGAGVEETVERATAYQCAGVQGLVVHSRASAPEKFLSVIARLPAKCLLIAIPTSFFQITASELADRGIDIVIYANHGLRAQVAALREIYRRILQDGSSEGIEMRIASVHEVFELQRSRIDHHA